MRAHKARGSCYFVPLLYGGTCRADLHRNLASTGKQAMQTSEALQIIRALADGVDPTTGEVLEAASVYQDPQVVRALFAAADALERRARTETRSRRLPGNAGSPWSEQEEEELCRGFDGGTNIADLAKEHGRTEGAIRSRLEKLGKISFGEGPKS